MKVLLRDLKTGLYFGPESVCVKTPDEAADFVTLEAAGRAATKCAGEDMAVILRYDDPNCELALNPDYCTASTAVCDAMRMQTAGTIRPIA